MRPVANCVTVIATFFMLSGCEAESTDDSDTDPFPAVPAYPVESVDEVPVPRPITPITPLMPEELIPGGEYHLEWTWMDGTCSPESLDADLLYLPDDSSGGAVFVTTGCDLPPVQTSVRVDAGAVTLTPFALVGCEGTSLRLRPAALSFATAELKTIVEVYGTGGCEGTYLLNGRIE